MIEQLIKAYLDQVAHGDRPGMSEEIIEKFGEDCKAAIRKTFVADEENETDGKRDFTLRFSNVGRPLCQLQMEEAGAPRDAQDHTWPMKATTGHILEALTIAVMKSAGVNVEQEQGRVGLPLASGGTLRGTFDVKIDGAIYDVKSASKYACDMKFGEMGGYEKIAADDPFGYIEQLHGYAVATGSKSGGWIVVNKETLEITVCPAHSSSGEQAKAIAKINRTVDDVNSKVPFERKIEPIEEKYYGKPTGNMKLDTTCNYCNYVSECWKGEIERIPFISSTAKNPTMINYTHIASEQRKKHEEKSQ